ncbi:MAG: radical SAM protein [Betaproteobacteria bacterium]
MSEKIRVSTGSAAVLGLMNARLDDAPTTIYLLTGGRCAATCAFCPQARTSGSPDDLLSRVSWPEFEVDRVLEALDERWPAGAKRVCVQVTRTPGGRAALRWLVPALDALRRCGTTGRFEISVCYHPSTAAEAGEVLALGADRIGIALDAACPEAHARTKPGSWEATMSLLEEAARLFPGRVSTHLIVGLGETEEDLVRVMRRLAAGGITVGLFAFTPVKGTAMERAPQPPIDVYRRVQLARHIIVNGLEDARGFRFSGGRIVGFGVDPAKVLDIARSGAPFQTSGCPGCNRPYYNERPGVTMYNYPRPLTPAEVERAISEARLSPECV